MEPESLNGNSWSGHHTGNPDDEATPVWNKVQHVLYGSNNANTKKRRKQGGASARLEGLLHKDFVKKYLQYAKRLSPALSDGARETIAAEYALLRAKVREGRIGTETSTLGGLCTTHPFLLPLVCTFLPSVSHVSPNIC